MKIDTLFGPCRVMYRYRVQALSVHRFTKRRPSVTRLLDSQQLRYSRSGNPTRHVLETVMAGWRREIQVCLFLWYGL